MAMTKNAERSPEELAVDRFIDGLITVLESHGIDATNWDGEDAPHVIVGNAIAGMINRLKAEVRLGREMLEKEVIYSRMVERENRDWQNRILSAHRMGSGEHVSVTMSVRDYMMFDAGRREEILTEAVIDVLGQLLRHASREAHLNKLRAQVGKPMVPHTPGE